MKAIIVQFPGSNCDADACHVIQKVLAEQAQVVWHGEQRLPEADLVVLPGGFAHGDYLRTGAMAKFSPIMPAIKEFAEKGGLVLGICNGFQVLAEAGLLPGVLLKNIQQQFVCDWAALRVENAQTQFTSLYREGEVIRMPVAHGEGRYYIDEAGLKELEKKKQIVFRYEGENVNGSVGLIAGVCNLRRNVLGLMPHPERAGEAALGGTDGLRLFQSVQKAFAKA